MIVLASPREQEPDLALLQVRVASVKGLAEGILSLEFRSTTGAMLPPFTAGAHIDVHLGSGLVRSYSLVNPQEERHRYVIAVNRDRASRGGSTFIHNCVKQGDMLTIGAPRNDFALAEDATDSLLIAGGIGITPLWCMIQRLEVLKRRWTLYYSARTRRHAALLAELQNLRSQRGADITFHFDDEAGGRLIDIGSVVARAGSSTHLYCCGPVAMLEAFQRAALGHPHSQVHLEYFTNRLSSPTTGGFTLVLARSGLSLAVPHGKTILQTLFENGFDVPHSCQEGICGTCETRVLEGIPDHRDVVLSREVKDANQTMMICCSGSKSEKLVLDL
jgi:ferredoxin-NADP reductase